MVVLHALAFVAGAAAVAGIFLSAVHTFVVPRAYATRLTRVVFVTSRRLFQLRSIRARTYEDRDRAMALYAPLTLLVLAFVWLVVVDLGYTGMLWGIGGRSLRDAFLLSGSSLFTLGIVNARGVPTFVLVFSEAAMGIGLLALLISYLPTIYAAFGRRENAVAVLEVRAGSPPSAEAMIKRYHLIHGLERLEDFWPGWETWFADIDESHTSFGSLSFFRSPQPERSWVTAAGAVLDTASFVASTIDGPRSPGAEICVRAGYVALRHIADFFSIPYDPDPAPGDPISIERQEFDDMCDRLAGVGVPLKTDRDRAWRDFAGWRVNYDVVLLALAGLTMAPYAPWSSDRGMPYRRPPVPRWGRRRARA